MQDNADLEYFQIPDSHQLRLQSNQNLQIYWEKLYLCSSKRWHCWLRISTNSDSKSWSEYQVPPMHDTRIRFEIILETFTILFIKLYVMMFRRFFFFLNKTNNTKTLYINFFQFSYNTLSLFGTMSIKAIQRSKNNYINL